MLTLTEAAVVVVEEVVEEETMVLVMKVTLRVKEGRSSWRVSHSLYCNNIVPPHMLISLTHIFC